MTRKFPIICSELMSLFCFTVYCIPLAHFLIIRPFPPLRPCIPNECMLGDELIFIDA